MTHLFQTELYRMNFGGCTIVIYHGYSSHSAPPPAIALPNITFDKLEGSTSDIDWETFINDF